MGQRTFTAKDINNPIHARFIIVDEVSMLDLETCAALLPAVQSGALLLLVGDADQLQSVSYGNILFDFIRSGSFEVYRLTEVMRQSGTIYTNAKKIRDDDANLTLASDFQIFRFHRAEDAVNKLLSPIGYSKVTGTKSCKRWAYGCPSFKRIDSTENRHPHFFAMGIHLIIRGIGSS